MMFSIKDFFSKFNKIRLRIWLLLLKKSLMENFSFCAVRVRVKMKNSFCLGVFSLVNRVIMLLYEEGSNKKFFSGPYSPIVRLNTDAYEDLFPNLSLITNKRVLAPKSWTFVLPGPFLDFLVDAFFYYAFHYHSLVIC